MSPLPGPEARASKLRAANLSRIARPPAAQRRRKCFRRRRRFDPRHPQPANSRLPGLDFGPFGRRAGLLRDRSRFRTDERRNIDQQPAKRLRRPLRVPIREVRRLYASKSNGRYDLVDQHWNEDAPPATVVCFFLHPVRNRSRSSTTGRSRSALRSVPSRSFRAMFSRSESSGPKRPSSPAPQAPAQTPPLEVGPRWRNS